MKILGFVQVGFLALFVGGWAEAKGPVIVHEWGTFTSLQDEHGNAIKGINVDDEPVPSFVYQYGVLVTPEYSQVEGNFGLPPYSNNISKGWMPGDPDVTMRLETPVLYLYPPKDEKPSSVPLLDVHVDFHQGILSQYYPMAKLSADPPPTNTALEKITSSLDWKNVRLGSSVPPIESTDKVWTTPREVSAPPLEVPSTIFDDKGMHIVPQSEHFLFYRGVGHLDSPLRLEQSTAGNAKDTLQIRSQRIDTYPRAWLTEIHSDGSCAFRTLTSLGNQPARSPEAKINAKFGESDFTVAHLADLKASMQKELVAQGLYPDEASAMLRTWELSYFKSPGRRFFYIVPRAWTDQVLPLKISGAPTQITRVMVGRIELITDEQQAALARLSAGPCPDLASVKKAASDALRNISKAEADAYYRGEKSLTALGIAIPPLVQDYLSLGRFRDALIVHEEQEHPSGALAQFIRDNGLSPSTN